MTQLHQHGTTPPAAAAPEPSPFEKFQALARRILTTPKAELVKEPAPAPKPVKVKRKR